MDPICHTLVGAALARSGLGQRGPYATATLLIAANLPDIDAFAAGVGSDTALCVRRGWTHGILAQVTFPLLLTGAVLLFHRLFRPGKPPPSARQLLLLSCIGLLTHPLLDWLNNYGVRLLMPFDGRWFYGDALYIADPWIWLILGTTVFLGYSRRWWSLAGWSVLAAATSALVLAAAPGPLIKIVWLVWVAVLALLRWRGAAATSLTQKRLARAALAVTTAYAGLMLAATCYGRGLVTREMAARGIPVRRMMVGPLPGTPFVRDVVVETPAGYRHGTLRFPSGLLDLSPRLIPKPPDTSLVRRALAAPEVAGFVNWARFPFVVVEESAAEYKVWILDRRYSRQPRPGFGAALVRLPKPAE